MVYFSIVILFLVLVFISRIVGELTFRIFNLNNLIPKELLGFLIWLSILLVISNFINLLFSMIALFIIMLFINIKISSALLFLPVSFIILLIFTLGITLIFSIVKNNIYKF